MFRTPLDFTYCEMRCLTGESRHTRRQHLAGSAASAVRARKTKEETQRGRVVSENTRIRTAALSHTQG